MLFRLLAAVTMLAAGAALAQAAAPLTTAATGPAVSITAPAGGAVLNQGDGVGLVAATSPGSAGPATGVDFYDGSTRIGAGADAGSGTWTLTWYTATAALGSHSLTAKATDAGANVTVSAPVTITVAYPPAVFMMSPSGGQAYDAPATVAMSAYAMNFNGTAISKVEFFSNGTKIGDGTAAGSNIWAFTWTSVPAGAYGLTAKATDVAGAVAISNPATNITVTGLPTPPIVAMTSPTSTTSALIGSTISLTATASSGNAGGSIASLSFYDGAALLGAGDEAGGGTYALAWNTSGATLGLHSVAAQATDNGGRSATSSPATVIQLLAPVAPTVAITSPTGTVTITRGAGSSLVINATASTANPGGSITSVEFFDGAMSLGFGTGSGGGAYALGWDATWAAAGLHNVTAKATDDGGRQTTSPLVFAVNVVLPPVAVITSPTSTFNATLGGSVVVTATVSTANPGASITTLLFFDDNSHVIGIGNNVGGSAYIQTWTTTGVTLTAGLHSVEIYAEDSVQGWIWSAPCMVNLVTPVPPSVAITSPTGTSSAGDGSILPIQLVATASTANPGGSIATVEFFDGSLSLGLATLSGGLYTLAWDTRGATLGGHFLTARATDDGGRSATSSPPTEVDIYHSIPPYVVFNWPTSPYDAEIGGTLPLTVTVRSQNPGCSISFVAFYEDTPARPLLGYGIAGSGDSWVLGWNTAGWTTGLHTVYASAMDTGNSFQESADVAINLFTPVAPTVAITSPTSTFGAVVGGTVALTATASTANPGGSIAGVQFFDGAASLGGGSPAGGGVYTLTWNTAGAAVGLHSVTARATDNGGRSATSSPATVINLTSPLPPGVALTTPTGSLAAGLGWKIRLSATTSAGSIGTVTGVEFFLDGATDLGAGVLVGGTWTSVWDTASVAYGTHSLVARVTDSGGLTGTSGAVAVQIRIPGDANGDSFVDGQDYGIWQKGYLRSASVCNTGDFNGDAFCDGQDYGIWQKNYLHHVVYMSDDFDMGGGRRDVRRNDVCRNDGSHDGGAAAGLEGSAPRLVAATPASGAVARDVTSMTLVFDSDVIVSPGAVEVSGLAGGTQACAAAYDAATRTLTLTLAAPLPADSYTVRVIGSFVVAADGGAALDGAASGKPGSDAVVRFTVE